MGFTPIATTRAPSSSRIAKNMSEKINSKELLWQLESYRMNEWRQMNQRQDSKKVFQ
jgi:hypothetical protein